MVSTLGILYKAFVSALNALKVQQVFQTGNPYIVEQTCTLAATNYDVDVNANLGRNGHWGSITAESTNTGTVSWAVSSDSATFSGFWPDLQAGQSYPLDGLDIDTVRVKSSGAGDKVIVEAH